MKNTSVSSLQQKPSLKVNSQEVYPDASARNTGRQDSNAILSDQTRIIDYGNPSVTEPMKQNQSMSEIPKGSAKLSTLALRDYYDDGLATAITKGLEEVGKQR